MEVLYLNVNGFAGTKNKRTKGDTNNIEIAKKILYEIFNKSDPEIIFLSEFNVHEDAGKYVIEYLEETKEYKRVYPDKCNSKDIKKGHISIVMAFAKKKGIESEKSPRKALTLKWNEIVYKGYRFVGVHIPSQDERAKAAVNFWDAVHEHYKSHENEKVIYIGDMNVYDEGTDTIKRFYDLIKAGAKDAWCEKHPNKSIEESYTHITREKKVKKRLDYAIMSEPAHNNLNDIKNIQEFVEEKLSDHSAILINLKDIE